MIGLMVKFVLVSGVLLLLVVVTGLPFVEACMVMLESLSESQGGRGVAGAGGWSVDGTVRAGL